MMRCLYLIFLEKKYLKLTPEEYVRQFCINSLCKQYQFPISMIKTEQNFSINQKLKRADIIVYKNQTPVLVIECKAMHIKLTLDVFQQISTYQSHIQARFFILTNGVTHIFYEKKHDFWSQIEDLPNYNDI